MSWLPLRKTQRVRTVMLIAPAGWGSVGDEAMIRAAGHYLHKDGADDVLIVSSAKPPILAPDEVYPSYCRELHLPQHGSMQAAISEFRRQLAACSEVYCLGADVLDGRYGVTSSRFLLMLTLDAATVCPRTSILGFSLHPEIRSECVEVFRRMGDRVGLCLRDPVSFEVARELGLERITQTADVAFLLEPEASEGTSQISQWIQSQRYAGRRVVGLNVSKQILGKDDDSFAAGILAHREAVEQLCSDGEVSLLLIPHDKRPSQNDLKALQKIVEGLSPQATRHIKITDELLRAGEIKHLCSELDAVLTHRMHLAIASLSMGTPAMAVSYQGKVAGLYKLFDWPEGMLESDDCRSGLNLAGKVLWVLERQEEISAALTKHWAKVRTLAESNFAS